MRVLLVAVLSLAACGKSDAEREKDRIQDRAADELKQLKEHLGALEQKAKDLTSRLDDVDVQLDKLVDELSKATDESARNAIHDKLEKLKIDREDIERKLDELREQITR